jgi:hypothetical protein
MTPYDDDPKMIELLAPLRRLEPIPFDASMPEGRRWFRRPLVAVVVAVVALALVGVAIADGFGAFNRISAAQHRQTPADKLDSKDLRPDCKSRPSIASESPFCHLILGSARLVRTVPVGGKLWVVTDTHGDLCVILQNGGASCGSGLTRSQPTTITSFRLNGETPAISWGVTTDDVAAVSFPAGGRKVTVPVENNVWFYQGDDSGLGSMIIHFSDGSSERPQSDVSRSR